MLAVQFTWQHRIQALVKLIILNLKSPSYRPWVLLTDLNNTFVFSWMDGRTIYTSCQDAPTGWGIIMDLLQSAACITSAEPGQQAAASLPISARKATPAELSSPTVVISKVGMDEDEVAAYRLLYSLSVCPAIAPYLPLRPSS